MDSRERAYEGSKLYYWTVVWKEPWTYLGSIWFNLVQSTVQSTIEIAEHGDEII